MNIVKKFISENKISTCATGGTAAYLWIKDRLNKEIPLRDIDIIINTEFPIKPIIDKFLSYLPNTYQIEEAPISEMNSTIATMSSLSGLTYDLFINEDKIPSNTVIIDDIPVPPLDILIKDEIEKLNEREGDLKFIRSINELKEESYIVDKIERIKTRIELLKII